jgi:squalene synthase HpnC
VSVNHYENFPVASILCPPALRPAVQAIYHFARTADDIADEGTASGVQRLADLAAYRTDLVRVSRGEAASHRWAAVFEPLAGAMASWHLPTQLLADLLSAFEQDVTVHHYEDRAQLLDYCRRSANPVGRLLLHLYGIDDAHAKAQSDAICSALQLINFWQDFSVDLPRGRIYAPMQDAARHGVSETMLLACVDGAPMRALVADLCAWARDLMRSGAPLVHRIPGRAGWELRLVIQGGLRIAEKIAAMHYASVLARPRLRSLDGPLLLWRGLRMSAARLPA